MGTLLSLCVALLIASLSLNVFLYSNFKKLQQSKKVELIAPDELRKFISEVMNGDLGMIAVTRVDRENLLYRSPRDMK